MKKYDLIIASGATICYNKLAKDFTYIKTGGRVSTLIMPTNVDNLITSLQVTDSPFIFGGTTNSLISDNGLDGEVILTSGIKGITVNNNTITANCGEMLSKVCNVAKENGLSGMEGLSGIPGTVGGAVNMNAGAYGCFISDILDSVTAYADGKVIKLSNKECEFEYRTSGISKKNITVLSATFKLIEKNQILISNDMKMYKIKRRQSQPNDISLGSVFKKYENVGAGYYIENCGLKGYTIGGCKVSEKHANFIINTGNATSNDYAELVNICKENVYKKFNIKLEREVKYFGEFI